MTIYPRIKLIPDIVGNDEIIVREGDLVIPDVSLRMHGNLQDKALRLNILGVEPKIVIDSEGHTCLIFIKKRS